jgi:hypothetical protein
MIIIKTISKIEKLPIHFDLPRATPEALHLNPTVAFPEIVEVAGDANVLTTIFDDLVDLSLAPPFERLHTVCDLALAEGGRYDAVELGPESKPFFEIEHEVKGREFLEVLVGVRPEDLVVETAHVVADYQVGFEKEVDELVDLVLVDDQELVSVVPVGDAYGDSEAMKLAAPADLGKGALSFEVEDHDRVPRRHFALWIGVEKIHLPVPILQGLLQFPVARGV